MDASNRGTGARDLAEVADAIDAVGRWRGLAGWSLEEWRDAAWARFLPRAERLRAQFRGEASPRTYLGAVFANECLKWMTRGLPRLERAAGGLDDLAGSLLPRDEFVDPIQACDDARADADIRRAFRSAWRQLAYADRKLLQAHVVEGHRMPAVAACAGCSPGAAHMRARRALAKLRALMGIPARPPARPPARHGEAPRPCPVRPAARSDEIRTRSASRSWRSVPRTVTRTRGEVLPSQAEGWARARALAAPQEPAGGDRRRRAESRAKPDVRASPRRSREQDLDTGAECWRKTARSSPDSRAHPRRIGDGRSRLSQARLPNRAIDQPDQKRGQHRRRGLHHPASTAHCRRGSLVA